MLSPEFRMLKAFLHNPSKEMYGRQIERMTDTSHERAVFYLDKLSRNGILAREKKGRQVFYLPNGQNELAQKALSIAEMERKMEFIKRNGTGFFVQDLVSQIAAECGPSIHFILLFGSVARKQAKAGSDIDLLFALPGNGNTKARIQKIIKRRETISGKKISFHPITLKELEKAWLKEPVYKNIWDERIVFFGEENFWRFVFRNGTPK
jgi:predicted nucleotidyltransferase